MAVSRALRRLLSVLELEEEQAHVALERSLANCAGLRQGARLPWSGSAQDGVWWRRAPRSGEMARPAGRH